MAKVRSFRDLIVWQKSVSLAIAIYKLTKELPREELYGLSSQMRRAAISIASNVAEGARRKNRAEYRQFCGIALGSAAELETQLIIALKVYPTINFKSAVKNCVEIQKLLYSLILKLKSNPDH